MASRADSLFAWLVGIDHNARRGHWPTWYELGAGERQCLNCLRGGRRSRLPRLTPQLAW